VARGGGELVRPFRTHDCSTCEWFDCAEVAGPDDASFALAAGHLNVREWLYLYGPTGRLTVDDLARTDAASRIDGFREQSVGTANPDKRLRDAIRRAQMTVADIEIQPREAGWLEVPCADIEVDFDIEWDTDGRIYQWGLRIRDGQDDETARYEPIVSFDPLDEPAEEALAEVFAARLDALKAEARQADKTLLVFHWHHVEVSLTRKFAAVAAVLDGITCDLLAWFNANFFARQTASIKNIAPLFGFQWGVDDAGGRVSQLKIDQARGGGPDAEEARQWCLRYNESDVAAQAAIRDGLRA
jgi:predicted RecB family nuclease